MLFKDTLATAVKGVMVNRMRAFLATLGIVIGVGAVVLMVSIGRSFQHFILSQIESFGNRIVDVYPTGFEKFGGNLDSLTMRDYERIARLPTVENATPIIMVNELVSYGREEATPMVLGTEPAIFSNYGLKIDHGRLLDRRDVEGAGNVVVLSSKIAEDLLGDRDPIGEKITIDAQSFTIVGVLGQLGSRLTQNVDNHVYIPYSTARVLTGQRHVSFINLLARGDPSVTRSDITLLLRDLHAINNPSDDPDKDDFVVRSAEQILGVVSSVTLGLTVFLSVIAAISLLVGGIGIMNIMLVSVTERTREIGLRKAVGARKRDILAQFLIESVALTVAGGAMGVAGGMGLAWLLSRAADKVLGGFSFVLSPVSVILAISMAAGTGLVFGLYPAMRAADLDPIRALVKE